MPWFPGFGSQCGTCGPRFSWVRCIPGLVAGLIGFFVFRSRVRGVFFAVLTQAITLAAWLVFTLNDIKCGGTNGLTRFDRVILGSHEKVQVQVEPLRMEKFHLSPQQIGPAIDNYAGTVKDASVTASNNSYVVTVPHGQHPWNMMEAVQSLKVGQEKGAPIKLSDVADVRLAGFPLTDPQVKLGLYLVTVLA